MSINWRTFYGFLFLYRCAYSAFAYFFVSRLTGLGDAARIVGADFTAVNAVVISESVLQGSRGTAFIITQNAGKLFNVLMLGSDLLVYMCFQSIAFVGLVKVLMSLEPSIRKRATIILLLPSFSVWSSIPSKEVFVVFAAGVICSYVVDMYYKRERLTLLILIAFLTLAIFKTHYMIAFGFLVIVSKLAGYVRQKAFFAFVSGIVSLIPLYLFRDRVDELSFQIIPHFAVGFGRMTREAPWVEQYDVFWKAPYGMFQSFFGPTLREASEGILQLASFIESTILMGILLFLLLRRLADIPAYNFILGLFATFWMLFPTYPLGIMNPGSAVRYRTGYLVFMVVIFAFFTSREVYASWRAGGVAGERRPTLRLSPSRGQP